MKSSRVIDWLLLLSLVVLWGSAFAVTKVALETITPEWTVAFRILLGACVLLPATWLAGQSLPRAGYHWAWFAALAVCGNIVPFYVISWGQQHIASSLAGILVGSIPIVTLLLAHIFVPGERLTPMRTTGFLTGFAGLLLIIGPDALASIEVSGTKFWAQLSVLAGALFYATNSIIARRAPGMPVLSKSAGVLLLSSLFSAPIAIMIEPTPLAAASSLSLAAILALGLLPTALATIIFFRLIDRAGPSFASLINYLVPVFALTVGILIMGEEASYEMLGGLALILSGIAISEINWRRGSRS